MILKICIDFFVIPSDIIAWLVAIRNRAPNRSRRDPKNRCDPGSRPTMGVHDPGNSSSLTIEVTDMKAVHRWIDK
jgi:hypothetical protein